MEEKTKGTIKTTRKIRKTYLNQTLYDFSAYIGAWR